MISLKRVNHSNVRRICDEVKLRPDQEIYTPGAATSIAEAAMQPQNTTIFGVYYLSQPIGLITLWEDAYLGRSNNWTRKAWLWRFMIDYRHQRKGYGTKAIKLLEKRLKRDRYQTIRIDVEPGPESPEPFYVKLGYTSNHHRDGIQMEKNLASQTKSRRKALRT